ncbi:permease prefix domain 1-containing protein [Alkalicoccus luteus]|uniref:permease prefix domain 1-containing protein n=1 Tax=Alkalicoccus luteus TaxID=1237094 RepID=UPI004033B8B3
MNDQIRTYIDSVLNHIDFKDAHVGIRAELEAHLHALIRTYKLRGYSESASIEKAVCQMGSPVRTGKSLNKIHRPKTDWLLISLIVILLGIGLVIAYFVESWDSAYPAYYMLVMQADLYGLVLLTIIVTILVPIQKLLRYWSLFILAALIIGMFATVKGISNSGSLVFLSVFDIFYLNVPAALSLLFLLGWSGLLSSIRHASKRTLFLYITMVWMTISSFLILPNLILAGLFLLLTTAGTMFTLKNIRYRLTLFSTTWLPVMIIVFYFSSSYGYAAERLNGIFTWGSDTYHAQYIPTILSQAKWIAGNSHAGINSDTFYLLPFDYTFLFVIHYGGILFALFTCMLLLLIVSKLLWNINAVTYYPLRIIGWGAVFLLVFPILWNLLTSSGLVAATFLPMPFITPGSSMQIYYAALFGIVINIHRQRFVLFNERQLKEASE